MADFESSLNSWFIPLFTPQTSVWAKAAYRSAKVAAQMNRPGNVIKTIGGMNPKKAAGLKRELTRPSNNLSSPSSQARLTARNSIGFLAPIALVVVHTSIMKPAGMILALMLSATLTVAVTAQLSPPPSPEVEKIITEPSTAPKLSPAVSKQLNDKLPKYAPAASEPEKPAVGATTPTAGPTADAATDPDILHLKKVTVTPRKRPRLTDDVMMTTKAYNDKLAKEKLSSFDRNFLNKFTWFGGVSAADRAREEHDRDQRTQMANDVFGLAKVVEVSDPEQAKALRDAINRP